MIEPVKLDLIHPIANPRVHMPQDPVSFPRTEMGKHGKVFLFGTLFLYSMQPNTLLPVLVMNMFTRPKLTVYLLH